MPRTSYPLRKKLWPIPDSMPRAKALTYLFLIFSTAILMVLYNYSFKVENWTYKNAVKASEYLSTSHFEITSDTEYDLSSESAYNESELLKKLLYNLRALNTTNGSSRSVRPILDKTSIFAQKFYNLSESYVNKSSTGFGKNIIGNVKSLTMDSKHTGVPTRGKSKILNETSGDQITVREQLNTTIGLFGKNKTGNVKSYTMDPKHTGVPTTGKAKNLNETSGDQISIGEQLNTTIGLLSTSKLLSNDKDATTYNEISSTIKVKQIQIEGTTGNLFANTTMNKTTDFSTTVNKTSTTVNSTTIFSTIVNKTSMVTSVPQKGYLVYSAQCKLPDIDPMHPSIRHMIEKNPPLDCSKDHEPLTRTEDNFLILDEEALQQKFRTNNYTCCYKSIFRIKDGVSDNGVGFGADCIKLLSKTVIKDEFITVECKYSNDTLFYQEFHSFIFDKPQVEKRCGNRTKSQYSVLIIGVDAMSRLNMHRQLNATANYLLKEMDAVEMYGFNKVGDNTFPNLIPMLVGYSEDELPSICWKSSDLPLDRCNFLWKSYAKNGYRTLYAEDSPHISSFNYLKDGFFHQPTDYYFRHFILAYEDALGRDKPLNCYKCVGSISETEAVLQWTGKFASHFSERPYFSFSWINSLTHDFLNMGSSGDQMYEKFFRNLHRSGALNKTVVVLMGDHGMRWGEIRKTYIGRLEERLPMLLIALPEEFKRQYPKFAMTLKENSHRLVTPFDLHATLVHLLDLTDEWNLENTDKVDAELAENFTRRALSMFQPIPNDRSCDDAFIEEHWCTCESSLEVDLDNNEVKQVAQFLLSSINDLLKSESEKCAKLTLESISDARLWQPSLEHEGHSADDNIYTVIIHTDPSKAIFEGTVKLSQPHSETTLLGTISRLNLYGNQSSCIDDAVLRKYCYCL